MEKTSNHKSYKILPYEPFELDCFVPWLEEQARNGLFLEYISAWGWAKFRRKEPVPLHYRVHMEPDGCAMEPEALEAYQENGWEWVAHDYQQRYHIFAKKTEECLTGQDSEILEVYVKRQRKWLPLHVLGTLVIAMLWLYMWSRNWMGPWQLDSIAILLLMIQISLILWLLLGEMVFVTGICRADCRRRSGALRSPDPTAAHPVPWRVLLRGAVPGLMLLTGILLVAILILLAVQTLVYHRV